MCGTPILACSIVIAGHQQMVTVVTLPVHSLIVVLLDFKNEQFHYLLTCPLKIPVVSFGDLE